MILRVIINLVQNSIDALENTKEPSLMMELQVKDNFRIIKVSDNGEGIEGEMLKEIFIPFFSTKKKGSGIGLSISRQIILQHGGDIAVKSKPGSGTTFTLSFP